LSLRADAQVVVKEIIYIAVSIKKVSPSIIRFFVSQPHQVRRRNTFLPVLSNTINGQG
jgi:hypothetical protein